MDGYGLKKALTGGNRWRRWGGNLNTGTFTDTRHSEEVYGVCVVFPSTVERRVKKCAAVDLEAGELIYTL